MLRYTYIVCLISSVQMEVTGQYDTSSSLTSGHIALSTR
jgi:hypothetical protein